MTTTFEQFRSYMSSDIGIVPKPVAIIAIVETVRKFCQETEILKVDATNITVAANTAEFTIAFTGVYEPVSIDKNNAYLGDGSNTDARLIVTSKREMDESVSNWKVLTTDGDITRVFLTQSGKARVYPIVETTLTDYLRLHCAVKPTRAATSMVDDLIYDDHIEAIRSGTLARIYDMVGRSWYNPGLANTCLGRFERAMANARGLSIRGKNNNDITAKVGIVY